MSSDVDLKEKKRLDRRTFLKGAAAAAGGLAFTQWAFTNFEAAAQNGQAYVIVSDVIRGSGGDPTGPGCVETSLFKRGEQLVWRAVVFDARTGEAVNTPEAVEARGLKVTAQVEGRDEVFELEFGPHPPNAAEEDQIFYWAAPWIIPPNVTGKFKYTLTVEDQDGGQGVLEIAGKKDLDTFPSALTIE